MNKTVDVNNPTTSDIKGVLVIAEACIALLEVCKAERMLGQPNKVVEKWLQAHAKVSAEILERHMKL